MSTPSAATSTSSIPELLKPTKETVMYTDLEQAAHQQITERLRLASEPHLTPRHPVRRRTASRLRRLADRLDTATD
jgi:hypothetical protein